VERRNGALMEKYTLKELKIAVFNKDMEKLKEITKKEPSFSSVEEAKEIVRFIKLAVDIINEEKAKLSKDMQEIKKLKKFNLEMKNSGKDFIA
jgi:hypothetical protein